MEDSNITVYDNGFGLVENSQPTSLIGFRDHINKRQELIEQLCNSLKVNINKALDDYCEELRSCIEDKRSYMSVAYWWGSVATSEQEILQMILLESELSILDETDSGLDIDALKIISNGINTFMDSDKAIILITHYQRLLDYIKPDFVHVMQNGKIIKTGNSELAKELELKGYEWLN